MKTILLVASNGEVFDVFFRDLFPVFEDYTRIITRYIYEVSEEELNTADIVLFPNAALLEKCRGKGYRGDGIVCRRAVDFTKLGQLFSIPQGSNVYLVSRRVENAKIMIEELTSMGFTFFHMIPVSCEEAIPADYSITWAITLGLSVEHFSTLMHVIDIGFPIVNISTIVEIIYRLDLPSTLASSYVGKYSSYMTGLLKDFSHQILRTSRMQAWNQALLDNIKNGVCLINQSLRVVTANKTFCEMFGLTETAIQNQEIVALFRQKGIDVAFQSLLQNDYVYRNTAGEDIILYAFEPIHEDLKENFYIINASNGKSISKKAASLLITHRPPQTSTSYSFKDYISQDDRVKEILERAKKVAQHNSTVLILGESGTGKEILAQGIHYASFRKTKPFVAINFAGMQPELIESELFGYEDGAFTGARRGGKPGLWEIAHTGTIFLDEIGDAPLSLQVNLLRVLQEKAIRRVGGHEYIPVDTRVIAATNKNLWELVNTGAFRKDLFYRLNVIPIHTIPLRERKRDLFLLFEYFLRIHFKKADLQIETVFTQEMMKLLMAYDWPGNTRELQNICEYFSCIYTEGKYLTPEDLPEYLLRQVMGKEELPDGLDGIEKAVADIIRAYPKVGRMRICSILAERGVSVGEGTVRSTLRTLAEKGIIRINRTKGGCEIVE